MPINIKMVKANAAAFRKNFAELQRNFGYPDDFTFQDLNHHQFKEFQDFMNHPDQFGVQRVITPFRNDLTYIIPAGIMGVAVILIYLT